MAYRVPRSHLTQLTVLLLLPFSLSGQSGRVEHLRRGDTTIIRTSREGVWGTPSNALPVVRIGGPTKSTPFGSIRALAALPSGGVVIYDGNAEDGPVAMIFSPEGNLQRTFARRGGGPGELDDCNTDCIVVASTGAIAMHDFGRRVNFYNPDGSFRTSFLSRAGMGFLPQFLGGPGGSVYLKVELARPIATPHFDVEDVSRFGFVRLNENGRILDTIRPPASWIATVPRSGLEPTTQWLPLPSGQLAVGGTDRTAVVVRPLEGRGPLALMEVIRPRVPFLDEERKELHEVAEWFNREGRSPSQLPIPTDPPRVKPAYKALQADNDNRIWLQRYVAAVRIAPDPTPSTPVMRESGTRMSPRPEVTFREPPVFVAFRLDGTYLGEVRFPLGTTHISFAGDFAWAVSKDENDQEYLVKYELHGTVPR